MTPLKSLLVFGKICSTLLIDSYMFVCHVCVMKMSNMTSESEERINSPNDEASSERNMIGNGTLKKGPWTSAEDAILVDYVNKNGEGNWNAVQKHSGLSRCGKSCRLRWENHLRPDLKKGTFTPKEERHIIELHVKMGNKWARMAIEVLPNYICSFFFF